MFEFYKVDNAAVCAPTIKQIPANAAVTYAVGDALTITSGKAAKATGSTKPAYICAEKATGADVISAYQVDSNSEYLVGTTSNSALTVGAKYTIHTDAAQITSTTNDGVAEVIKAVGSKYVVKF